MTTRRLQIDSHRIARWVRGFADRHDGAQILAVDGTGAGPSVGEDDDGGARAEDLLTLAGGDGAIAQLSRWAGAHDPTRPEGPLNEQSAAAIGHWATPPEHLGLILVRRGGYALGLSHGRELLTHKSGTRYVQSRTAAGGWSQQRFARRRGNQASALVSTVAEHAIRLLIPAPAGTAQHRPAALVLGGDRTLGAEVMAVSALADLADLPRRELPDLPDPRHAVLIEALRRGRCVPVLLTEPH